MKSRLRGMVALLGVLTLAACNGSGADTRAGAIGQAVQSGAPSSSTPAPVRDRSESELKASLLTLQDVPAGRWDITAKHLSSSQTPYASSNPGCAEFLRLLNTASGQPYPGGVRTVLFAYRGRPDDSGVYESLDAMGSPQSASATVQAVRRAVESCPSVSEPPSDGVTWTATLTVIDSPSGVGDSVVTVKERWTSSDGKASNDAFVVTAYEDVVLTVWIYQGEFPNAGKIAQLAYKKLSTTLPS